MILEVIATCAEDAMVAEAYGADRLELVTAITEGGLTPGIGLVRQVVESVNIPVHVMVRPHSRSFVYSEADIRTMEEEVRAIEAAGAAGVVFGALTADRRIDESALVRILAAISGDMNVTFHRAFDELHSLWAGLHTLMQYPRVNRILTSGGPLPAPQSASNIRRLVERTRGSSLVILAGYGLTLETVDRLIAETKVSEVHFGSDIRFGRNGLSPIDPSRLSALCSRLKRTR